MNLKRATLLLAGATLCCVLSSAIAAVSIIQYTVDSSTCTPNFAQEFPDCATSWHCVDTSTRSVQGTAGYFLMFQGTVSAAMVANVSWIAGDMTSGSVQWKYTDSTYTAVVAGSLKALTGTVPTILSSSFASGAVSSTATAAANCLWSDPSVTTSMLGEWSKIGKNSEMHCLDTNSDFGSYIYYFPDGGVEPGVLSGVVTWGQRAFAGAWVALGGPLYPYGGVQIEKAAGSLASGMFVQYDPAGRRNYGEMYTMTWLGPTSARGMDCMKKAIQPPATVVDEYFKGTTTGLAILSGVSLLLAFVLAIALVVCVRRAAASAADRAKLSTANPVNGL